MKWIKRKWQQADESVKVVILLFIIGFIVWFFYRGTL